MNIERLVVGAFQTNCYILNIDDELLIIDPGSGFKKISEHIDAYNGKVVGILLTHGHFDHIGAVDALVKKYGCPVFASKDDLKMMRNEEYNNLAGYSATVKCDINYLESEKLKIGKFDIRVLFTPGHSNGSVMFVIGHYLFSGDTLFHGGVGRTDLYSGSEYKLRQSLEVLDTLDDDMIVYPGHESSTTVGYELRYNPFLR